MPMYMIKVNKDPPVQFHSNRTMYVLVAMEAFGVLSLPYPCSIKIWIPDLVDAGYGPYYYRIDDFRDMYGNKYGCPSVMNNYRGSV